MYTQCKTYERCCDLSPCSHDVTIPFLDPSDLSPLPTRNHEGKSNDQFQADMPLQTNINPVIAVASTTACLSCICTRRIPCIAPTTPGARNRSTQNRESDVS